MELRICCDASVKLEKMTNVNEIHCDIDSYNVMGDTLEGNIRISGKYIKDDMDNLFDFNETVPFTIVFKDRNFEIKKIEVEDFNCQEIINQGIECQFNIVVDYITRDEMDVEVPEVMPEEIVEPQKEEIIDIQEEIVEEVPVLEADEDIPVDAKAEDDYDEITISDDAIKAEINQKYNELLNEILEERAEENFYEPEPEKAITIHSGESNSDCRSFLNSIKEDYKSVKVYYTSKETDIEQICKNERVSVDKVYRDNQKSDFINKRRIIIK